MKHFCDPTAQRQLSVALLGAEDLAICRKLGIAPEDFTRTIAEERTQNGAPEWVYLLPRGRFDGRSIVGKGPWNNRDPEAVIRASLAAGRDLPIDYDHQSDFAVRPGIGGTAPAAGWIRDLELRENGICGRVEWTARGGTAVAGREYRFLCPVFTYATDGTVLKILRAALTNNPAIVLTALAGADAEQEFDAEDLAICRKLGIAPEDFMRTIAEERTRNDAPSGECGGLTADDLAVCHALGIAPDDYRKARAEEQDKGDTVSDRRTEQR